MSLYAEERAAYSGKDTAELDRIERDLRKGAADLRESVRLLAVRDILAERVARAINKED